MGPLCKGLVFDIYGIACQKPQELSQCQPQVKSSRNYRIVNNGYLTSYEGTDGLIASINLDCIRNASRWLHVDLKMITGSRNMVYSSPYRGTYKQARATRTLGANSSGTPLDDFGHGYYARKTLYRVNLRTDTPGTDPAEYLKAEKALKR